VRLTADELAQATAVNLDREFARVTTTDRLVDRPPASAT
jgi:hypothetical protein